VRIGGGTTGTRGRARTAPRSPAEVAAWCASFEEACRARGLRRTEQRRAVYRALASDPGHPTADAVRERLRRDLPTLSLATVYRVLDSLVDEGMVRRVPTARGGVRFDANTAPHQHLVCAICGSMADFTDPSLAALAVPASVPGGFRPEGLDLRVTGTCAACAGAARRAPRTHRPAPGAFPLPSTRRRTPSWGRTPPTERTRHE
jgi:Fur family peroxide stress response transcriptional regulator